MAVDIASTLGIGSGINVAELVGDLTNASFQPREKAVESRLSTATLRISALASAKSSLDTFSTALSDLLKGTAFSGQPTSNDPTVATAALIAGGVPKGLPAQLEVLQLAKAQVLQSAALANGAAVAGTGSLKFSVNGVDTTVTLASPANTLADLAGAINSSGAKVSASIVTDQSGSRLVIKGATGTNNAFTITAEPNADADLQRFASAALTTSQTASNAQVRIDNVDMEFTSNEITTAIPFVRINLNQAKPGTTVTLASDQPTKSMGDLVQEFVTAYNSLKGALNTSTKANPASGESGLLSADAGIRDMSRRLGGLVTRELTGSGDYRSLNDLGVSTQRDGTLKLDTVKLNAALAANPEAVTQMLNPSATSTTNIGIAGALKEITDAVNGTDGPLASSKASYEKMRDSLQAQLDKLGIQRSNYSEQLTSVYSKMQSRLVQFKATQSYLDQQIAAWNADKN